MNEAGPCDPDAGAFTTVDVKVPTIELPVSVLSIVVRYPGPKFDPVTLDPETTKFIAKSTGTLRDAHGSAGSGGETTATVLNVPVSRAVPEPPTKVTVISRVHVSFH